MGTYMYMVAERKTEDGWYGTKIELPFTSYALYGWLGNVRNHAALPPFHPDRGYPEDMSEEARSEFGYYEGYPWDLGEEWVPHYDVGSWTWYTVEELVDFDYSQLVENRRNTYGDTVPEGYGVMTSYGKLFGEAWFQILGKLVAMGAERVVLGWG